MLCWEVGEGEEPSQATQTFRKIQGPVIAKATERCKKEGCVPHQFLDADCQLGQMKRFIYGSLVENYTQGGKTPDPAVKPLGRLHRY